MEPRTSLPCGRPKPPRESVRRGRALPGPEGQGTDHHEVLDVERALRGAFPRSTSGLVPSPHSPYACPVPRPAQRTNADFRRSALEMTCTISFVHKPPLTAPEGCPQVRSPASTQPSPRFPDPCRSTCKPLPPLPAGRVSG